MRHHYFNNVTRCPNFDCEYNYSRKENKIDIRIVQTPIQLKYYREFTEHRLRLENQYKVDNDIIKTLCKFFEDYSSLHEKFQFVNRRTESCKTFSGVINIVPTETNEVEFREEVHQEKIEKKKETKLTINCTTKLRKTMQKKADLDDDEGSYVGVGKKIYSKYLKI